MPHSEWYDFAASYWWLLFPLGWGIAALSRIWTRHHRALRVFALIKAYLDQGKEPPQALLDAIEAPGESSDQLLQPLTFYLLALLLAAGSIGFGALGWLRALDGNANSSNVLFLAVLLAAGAAAFAIFAKMLRAHRPDQT